MASFVEGADELNKKLKSFEETFTAYMDARLGDAVRELQTRTAELVPQDTGQAREAVLSPEAVREKRRTGKGGSATWTFGLALTRELARKTYYLFWVEFGTKGYEAGERRRKGVTRTGRAKLARKFKRTIGARPAQPFFRPAVTEMMIKLRQTRAFGKIFAAAASAVGLNHTADT